MNAAARLMIWRDPLISLTALRFFKLAGVSPDQFLAGFRRRADGARMDLDSGQNKPPKVAQLIDHRRHGGACGVHHLIRPHACYLYSITSDFIFSESDWEAPDFEGTNHAILTLHRQRIPQTVLTALVGRPLTDLVGSDQARFFLSRHTRILAADIVPEGSSTAVELVLGDKWMPLSRFLKLL